MDRFTVREQEVIMTMLSEHKSLWSAALGQIKAGTNQIDVIPDAGPGRAHPYREDGKLGRLKISELSECFTLPLLYPRSRNGPAQLFWFQNHMESYASSLTTGPPTAYQ